MDPTLQPMPKYFKKILHEDRPCMKECKDKWKETCDSKLASNLLEDRPCMKRVLTIINSHTDPAEKPLTTSAFSASVILQQEEAPMTTNQ